MTKIRQVDVRRGTHVPGRGFDLVRAVTTAVVLVLLPAGVAVAANPPFIPPVVSPAEIHHELEGMRKPATGLPEGVPEWTMWAPQHAACFDPWKDNLVVQLFNECLIEMGRTADEIADPFRALATLTWTGFLSAIPQSAEAAGAVTGLPFDLYKCKVRAEIVTQLKAAGAPQSEIDRMRETVDNTYKIAGLLKLIAGLPSATSSVGDAVGTLGGASKARELFPVLTSLLYSEIELLEKKLDSVNTTLNFCSVDDFLDISVKLTGASYAYLEQCRKVVADHEVSVYCDASQGWGGSTAREKIEGARHYRGLEAAHDDEHKAVAEVIRVKRRLDLLERKAGDKLREQEEVREKLLELLDRVPEPLDACDVDGVRNLISELKALYSNPCLIAIGEGRAARMEIRNLERALEEFAEAERELQRYRTEIESALGTCSYQEAATKIGEMAGRLASWETEGIDLSQCPEPFQPWRPEDEYLERVTQGRKALSEARVESRDLLRQAGERNRECLFEEAWGLVDEARNRLEAPGCTINALNCGADTFDSDLCSLATIDDQRIALEGEITLRQGEVEEAAGEIESVATELRVWGDEKLELARGTTPQRCEAITRVRSIASDLEGLRPPLDCPGDSPYADDAADLRLRLDEAIAAFDERIAALTASCDEAMSVCDPDVLTNLANEAGLLESAACPPSTDLTTRLQTRQDELAREIEEARLILAGAQEDWNSWIRSCDVSLLETTEARESLYPTCGFENLDPDDRSRAIFLMEFGELAPLLEAKALRPGSLVDRAEAFIGEARDRLASGLAGEADRQAVKLILDQARAMLDAAREAAAELREGEWFPALCEERAADRISRAEAAIPPLPPAPSEDGDGGEATTGTVGDGGTGDEDEWIVMPNLINSTERLSVAWLEDLGLHPAPVQNAGPAPSPDKKGRVAAQSRAPDAKLRPGEAVTLFVYSAPTDLPGRGTAAGPIVTQTTCDTRWPGTVLTRIPATGLDDCLCPSGTAWSTVKKTCLSLAGAPPVHPADCRHMPGAIRNRTTGVCSCAFGVWDPAQGHCVDASAADRAREIAEVSKNASCEKLYSDIILFRRTPAYRDMAARAEREARELGCDAGRIAEATGAGGGGSGDDAPITPVTGPVETKDEGEARVSSRRVNICVIDVNSVLDDHYDLVVNGMHVGGVANPEGGAVCYGAMLRSGANALVLRLVATRGKSTYLKISINNDEYSTTFGGSSNHAWSVVAP